MSHKRAAEGRSVEHDGKPAKRVRTESAPSKPAPIENIDTARQLQSLLVFRQDGIPQLRHGITSFKAFLENLLYRQDNDVRPRQLSILREFLESEQPKDGLESQQPFLSQLWQAWSFAAQEHNDHLASAVAAILALLIRTLSGLLEFKELGLLLARTVLQSQHLRLIKRGLDAPKHKDFVISPCIRLLSEVASFDGGSLVREIYKRREQTCDIPCMRRNLGLLRQEDSDEDARRKPAIRTLTVRYILTLLKHLHEGGKNDLLKNRSLCVALFHHIREDPADLAIELLSETEKHVLKDSELPRSAKATLLTLHNLEKVAGLATRAADGHAASDQAFAWLKRACSTPEYGILRESAWYPAGTARIEGREFDGQHTIDLGLDGLEFYDKKDRPDVRNATLFAFIQTLRPHADLRERELVLACLSAAPELVAAYFAEKSMPLEPKLSNTWLNYATFVFEVVCQEIPPNLGNSEDDGFAQLPPQVSIMMENLLPRPLTRKVLTRCLNQSVNIITFFTIRILVVAFTKLLRIQRQLERASSTQAYYGPLWTTASERLREQFLDRCPSMKDMIAAFRKIPDDDDHILQKEACARLLRLYYEAAPVEAREETFDISTTLAEALSARFMIVTLTPQTELRSLILEHYLVIARHGSGMRWYNKHGTLEYTPITTLLRLHIRDYQNRPIRELLGQVLFSSNILNNDNALDALLCSLESVEDAAEIWSFVDECLTRGNRAPVKYVDDLEAMLSDKSEHTGSLPSLMSAVVLEQMAFAQDKPEVLKWVHLFLDCLTTAEVAFAGIGAVQKKAKVLGKSTEKRSGSEIEALLSKVRLAAPDDSNDISGASTTTAKDVPLQFVPLAAESDNRPELLRWSRKDLSTAIEDGDVGSLMLCLCSQYPDVRLQAHQQLRQLWKRLSEVAIDDKDTLSVLTGELIETFEQHFLQTNQALPCIAGTFASRAVQVLTNPTHSIYAKLNRYLIRSPEWKVNKMPSYWLSNTALARPDNDDGFWPELQWVLDWLVDGLQSQNDLDILRRSGTFEKVFAVFHSPRAPPRGIQAKVLELVYRATQLDGGSNTLVTRAGVLAWLDMIENGTARMLRQLVLDTSDDARLGKWAGMAVAIPIA